MRPIGILHVGAHLAEEANTYEDLLSISLGTTYWIESQPEKCQSIRNKLEGSRNIVIEATIWDESGIEMTFHETSNSESSSLLDLAKHAEIYPDIKVVNQRTVTTSRIDEIHELDVAIFDFINLDLQGVELRALKSLGKKIEQVKWIYSEVNKIELYRDCNLVGDLDNYLMHLGFKRISTRWIWNGGWGDAIYFKSNLITYKVRMSGIYLSVKWIIKTLFGLLRSALPESFRKSARNLVTRYYR